MSKSQKKNHFNAAPDRKLAYIALRCSYYIFGWRPLYIFPISFLWLLGAKIKDDVACFFFFYFFFFRRTAAVFCFVSSRPCFSRDLILTLGRGTAQNCVSIHIRRVVLILFFPAHWRRRRERNFFARGFDSFKSVECAGRAQRLTYKKLGFRPVFPIVVVQFRTQWRTAVIRESVALWYYNIISLYIFLFWAAEEIISRPRGRRSFVQSIHRCVSFFFLFRLQV